MIYLIREWKRGTAGQIHRILTGQSAVNVGRELRLNRETEMLFQSLPRFGMYNLNDLPGVYFR